MSVSPSLENNTILLSVSASSPYIEGYQAASIPSLQSGMFTRIDILGTYRWLDDGTSNVGYSTIVIYENIYEGKTIHGTFAAGEKLMMRYLRPGDVVLTKISDATTVKPSLQLIPDGAGWLREFEVGTDGSRPIAYCMEEDLSPTFPRWTAVTIL